MAGIQYRNRKAPPGYEDQQSVYEIKIEDDSILISEEPIVKSKTATHDLSALEDLIQLKYQTRNFFKHTGNLNQYE
jgi:hypothetical protein